MREYVDIADRLSVMCTSPSPADLQHSAVSPKVGLPLDITRYKESNFSCCLLLQGPVLRHTLAGFRLEEHWAQVWHECLCPSTVPFDELFCQHCTRRPGSQSVDDKNPACCMSTLCASN